MQYGPMKYGTATMASGADSCVAYFPYSYQRLFIHCPTMSTAADRYVQGSVDGTTYFPIHHAIISGLTSPGALFIGSGVTNRMVEIPAMAPYLKLVATAVVSGGGVYKFIYV